MLAALPLGFEPAPAPDPVLVHGSRVCALVYSARPTAAPGDVAPFGVAVLEFGGCLATRFGYPGGDRLAAHPLHSAGLDRCGVFEVVPSTWAAEVAYPADRPGGRDGPLARHFIATFPEATFECLAARWTGGVEYAERDAVLARVAAWSRA